MKILITGGTGFVGREVLRHLHGHSVRVLGRRMRPADAASLRRRYDAEVHEGDVADAASLKGACDGVEAVIHLVGIIQEIRANTFERVHVQGTENLLQEARRAGTPRLIHMSAFGARPDARSRYHQTKWAAEEAVRASGLDYTIFRPSIIYGPGDDFVNRLARLAWHLPFLPVVGRGEGRLQPVPVEIVASCFIRALTVRESIGRTFDVCGPDILTFNELVEDIMRVTGRRRLVLHLPVALARMAAGILERVMGFLGKPAPVTRDQILMLEEELVGDPAPLGELFRFKTIRFREAVSTYLQPR